MATENHNPFVLPGFGQTGDMAQNPLIASMEMMRKAWEGLAGASGMPNAAMMDPMSLEDLERRITDLRAVENWLRMNLSMLSSTIQGFEVQRATIATLKSFATNTAAAATPSTSATEDPAAQVSAVAQGWWDMLQKQFDSLAAATTATLQSAEEATAAVQQAASSVASNSTMGMTGGSAKKRAKSSASSPKPAAKKTAAKKRSRTTSG